MQWAGEPKLEEVLSDPTVRAVMARDRVDQEDLRVLLQDATKLLGGNTLTRRSRAKGAKAAPCSRFPTLATASRPM
jgi:hypothetical protein